MLGIGAGGPPEGTYGAASLSAGNGDTSAIAAAGRPSDSRRIVTEGTNRMASSSPVSYLESFREVRKAVLEHLRRDGDFHRARMMMMMMMVDYISDARAHDVGGEGQGFHGSGFKTMPTTTTAAATTTTAPVQQSLWQQLPLDDRQAISETVDEVFQAFFARAFASPPWGGVAGNELRWESISCNLNSPRWRNWRNRTIQFPRGFWSMHFQKSPACWSDPYREE
jgi:hypothetical protein